MATTEILQEYLTKLGFVVDSVSHKRMTDSLTATEKQIFKVGAGIAGMVVAAEVGVAAFAFQMEKMYYASKLTDSSVTGLMAVKYAGEQVGISADTMQSAVHGMAQAMRLNPGLKSLVESFGIKVTGRDISDVMIDFVRATKSMPEYVGKQYAGLFGMDADTYHLMLQNLDTLSTKQKENLDLFKQYGIDPDEAAETLKNYANSLRDVEKRVTILGQAVAIRLAPEFKAFSQTLQDTADGWIKIAKGQDTFFGSLKGMATNFSWVREFENRMGSLVGAPHAGDWLRSLTVHDRIKSPWTATDVKNPTNPQGMFQSLESKYNLPPGLLDSMWLQESNRGTKMTSPKGAQGHFQFMPETARHYKLKDPNDLSDSARAAAEYMHDLLKSTGGNLAPALAGYNWGHTTTTGMPKETTNYINSIMGRLGGTRLGGAGSITIQQSNTYNLHGGDTESVGKEIGRYQNRTNANLVRDLAGRLAG